MSNDNVFEKLYRVQASVNKMVLDGKREPVEVLRYIQRIVNDPDFVAILDTSPQPSISLIPEDGWAAE